MTDRIKRTEEEDSYAVAYLVLLTVIFGTVTFAVSAIVTVLVKGFLAALVVGPCAGLLGIIGAFVFYVLTIDKCILHDRKQESEKKANDHA